MDETNELIEHLPELIEVMKERLVEDHKRWGDTWKRLPREGQEDRILMRILDYAADFFENDTPLPWDKIIGNCWIAMMRERHPELLEARNDNTDAE
jgi:hypothetical protein